MSRYIILLAGMISLLIHGLLLVVLVLLPAYRPIDLESVYTVQLVSAPAKPKQNIAAVDLLKTRNEASQNSLKLTPLTTPPLTPPPLPQHLSADVVKTEVAEQRVIRSADLNLEGQVRLRDKEALLAWRVYLEEVSEKVKENYDFPAGFAPQLRAVVKVKVGRNGNKQEIVLTQPSGDERFDQLVCLARISNTIFPPLPQLFSAKHVVMVWTCTP